MEKIIVICPKCKRQWNKKKATESWEEDYIVDSTSDICPSCSLLTAFKKNPENVTAEIHKKQRDEGNFECFNTEKKSFCAQNNCLWQGICDREVVESLV